MLVTGLKHVNAKKKSIQIAYRWLELPSINPFAPGQGSQAKPEKHTSRKLSRPFFFFIRVSSASEAESFNRSLPTMERLRRKQGRRRTAAAAAAAPSLLLLLLASPAASQTTTGAPLTRSEQIQIFKDNTVMKSF